LREGNVAQGEIDPALAGLLVEPTHGSDHAHAQFATVVLRDAHGNATQHIKPGAPLTVELSTIGDSHSPLEVILRWRTPLGLLLFESRLALPVASDGTPRVAACHFPALPIHSDDVIVEVLLSDPVSSVTIDSEEFHLHLDAPHGPLLQVEHSWVAPGTIGQNGTAQAKITTVAGVGGK
jgi:hypothetical protein